MRNTVKLFLLLTVLTACKKESSKIPDDNGCISRIYLVKHSLSDSTYNQAVQLMQQNKIPLNDIIISNFRHYTEGTTNSNNADVSAYQFANNQPIFNSDLSYDFINGQITGYRGSRYNSIPPLDTVSSMRLPQLRALYIKEVGRQPDYYGGFLNLKDSCLTAQFGYFDVNVAAPNTRNIVKAWQVKFKGSGMPIAVFDDKTGKTLSYYSPMYDFGYL